MIIPICQWNSTNVAIIPGIRIMTQLPTNLHKVTLNLFNQFPERPTPLLCLSVFTPTLRTRLTMKTAVIQLKCLEKTHKNDGFCQWAFESPQLINFQVHLYLVDSSTSTGYRIVIISRIYWPLFLMFHWLVGVGRQKVKGDPHEPIKPRPTSSWQTGRQVPPFVKDDSIDGSERVCSTWLAKTVILLSHSLLKFSDFPVSSG